MIKKFTLFLALFFTTFLGYGQFDIAMSPSISSPMDGCYLSATETITVTVVNAQGTPYAGTFDITYVLDFGTPVTESVTTAMPGSGTYIYSFPAPDDFSSCAAHNLQVYIFDPTDINNLNDTIVFTVLSDCDPVVGTLSGPGTVCTGMNSGNIELTGYTGNIQQWGESTDAGSTWSWTVTADDTLPYLNITTQTIYEVIVESQFNLCPQDTTAIYTVYVDALSDAGTLPADFDICDNGNGDTIIVTGYTGAVLDWLSSSDNGTTWASEGNTSDSLEFINLTDTTLYQVIVKNGVCPADTSTTPITLTLIPGSYGGLISGEDLVCNFDNDSSLLVTGYNDSIIRWYVSTDSGLTWQPTLQTDSIFDYSNLTGYTMFTVEVQVGACASDFAIPHAITVLPLNIGPSGTITIDEGDTIVLNGTGGTSYSWFPDQFIDDTNTPSPSVWPDSDLTYSVAVTDINGCVDTTSVLIVVLPDLTALVIPNLITPNGDGFNDNWIIENIDNFTSNELVIFNIYGQQIYEAQPYGNGVTWDGTYNNSQLPDGSYFYLIRLNDPLFEEPIQGVITIAGND
jgi:gliding motility-associated-like protein